jgi:hypothetical protein
MKRFDIRTVEERSSVLKETSHELSKDSRELRFASLRLCANSKNLMEEVKKNIRLKKAAPSGVQTPLEEHSAV